MTKFDAWNEAEKPDYKYYRCASDQKMLAIGAGVTAVLVLFVALVGVVAFLVTR